MWPLINRNMHEHCAIILYADHLHMVHLRHAQNADWIEITYAKKFPLNAYDMHQGIFYNSAGFERALHYHQKISSADSVLLVLGPSCIKESTVWSSVASPAPSDLSFADRERSVWQYQYLYPADQGGHHFYLSALYPWMLFQYQAIAARSDVQLVRVESLFSALLAGYKQLYATAFRAAQLRVDMVRTDGKLAQAFSKAVIAQRIKGHGLVCEGVQHEQEILFALLGLCAAERGTNV